MFTYTNLPHPSIFAHRGASIHAPENTIAAFELAIQQGCDGIEFDVMLSGDNHVMVIHDNDLSRTTGVHGKISELSEASISELDAGSFFDIQFQNERIPTLDQVLEVIGSRTFLNIELKNYESIYDNLPEYVAEIVKNHGLHSNILFSSFNPIALRKINKLLPLIPIGLLALPGLKGWWARSFIGRRITNYQALHPEFHDISPNLVQKAHRNNTRIHTYTVNNSNDIQRLLKMNVDGIFTDDPQLARKVQIEMQWYKSPIE